MVQVAGTEDDVQSTLRSDPEAFLAKKVIVCEGASEVGFIRGMDQHWTSLNGRSMLAAGTSFVNVGGGQPDRCFRRGLALRRLGYRVMVLLDADVDPTPAVVQEFQNAGGEYITWRPGRALEDELFLSLPDAAIDQLLQHAEQMNDADIVNAHINTHSNGTVSTAIIQAQRQAQQPYSLEVRQVLAAASRTRRSGWFKSSPVSRSWREESLAL
ncbi:hypothetical protein P4233_16390 [Pseudomonas aeruginosa]|nr:hypothetical protein [Pseudomonas aeruginosa]